MRKLPLIERKAALKAILPKSKLLLYSAHVVGNAVAIHFLCNPDAVVLQRSLARPVIR